MSIVISSRLAFSAIVCFAACDASSRSASSNNELSSDELINLLEEFLEYPEVDPHGYPIPDKNGKIKKSTSVVAITELNENDSAKVIRVNDDVKNLLSYVTKIGISLGKEILIKDKLEYDGSVLMMIDKKEVNISNKIYTYPPTVSIFFCWL
jgi:DtxR family Mn-dependent transcriptional regulator